MKLVFAAFVALLAVPAAAQDARPMSLEQQLLLRCSAVFAIVASEQARGVPSAGAHPPLGERGREFFVRSGARLMDELGLSREGLAARMQAEVELLRNNSAAAGDPAAYVASIVRPCLAYLDAGGQ